MSALVKRAVGTWRQNVQLLSGLFLSGTLSRPCLTWGSTGFHFAFILVFLLPFLVSSAYSKRLFVYLFFFFNYFLSGMSVAIDLAKVNALLTSVISIVTS